VGAIALTCKHTAPEVALAPAHASPTETKPVALPKVDSSKKEINDRARRSMSLLPLSFEKNQGQTDERVKYLSRGDGYTLLLTQRETLLTMRDKSPENKNGGHVLRMSLKDSNPAPKVEGVDGTQARSNYLIGKSQITGVENFSKVKLSSVYDGIDVVYYGNQGKLEYDFVVAPNADPAVIKIAMNGADKAAIDAHGDLVLSFSSGEIRQHRPVLFQKINGKRTEVDGSYKLLELDTATGTQYVTFNVGAYDTQSELVIDPVLVFSTLYCDRPQQPPNTFSDHSGDERGSGIAIDGDGNVYVVGRTNSIEIPVVSPILNRFDNTDHNATPFNPHGRFNYDGFLVKFNPDASAIVYSTYLGGQTGDDDAVAIVVDSLNGPYIAGNTNSSDFPVKNAVGATPGGNGDVFLIKLNAAGSNVVFSTYLGGGALDTLRGMALDVNGNIYLTGVTASSNFRIANAVQPTYGGGPNDGFLTKFTNDGSVVTFSTYIGGSGDDGAGGVIADPSGNSYVVGYTTSNDFPLFQPIQIQKGAGRDVFLTKFNSTGTVRAYSTYLGGGGDDAGTGIALDPSGNVYLTGTTTSLNFPTVSPTVLPVQSTNGGGIDGFVSKVNPFGTALVFSTYLGGEADDIPNAIAVDSRGAIYVAGGTRSNLFPVAPQANTLQSSRAGGLDGFLSKFNPTGVPLVYSTYFGSDHHHISTDNTPVGLEIDTDDEIRGLCVDNNGNAYVTGYTMGGFVVTFGSFSQNAPALATGGEDFPAPANHVTDVAGVPTSDPSEAGADVDQGDAYVSKIADSSPLITSAQVATGTLNTSFTYTIVATNNPDRFNAAGLPGGLSVNAATGQISGVPGVVGNFPIVLTASNASGTGAQILFLTISTARPVIDNTNLSASGRVGDVFRFTIPLAPGSEPANTYSSSVLPSGLNLDAITGLISGVPLIEGVFSVQVVARNGSGNSVPETLVLTILPPVPDIRSSSNAQAVIGQPFSYTITATNTPKSYNAVSAPNLPLPTGLTINTTTGILSGTLQTSGSFNIILSATNTGGTGTLPLTLQVITAAVPQISSLSTATAIINEPFSFTVTANNSPQTYRMTPVGSIPPGLTFNDATGVLSGIPTGPATVANLTQTAINAAGSGIKTFDLTIANPNPPVVNSPLTQSALQGAAYVYDITATNNPTGFGAVIPPTLSWLTGPNANGRLSGTPPAGSPSGSFTVTASNAGGVSAPQTVNLTVSPPPSPSITSPNMKTGVIGVAFSYAIVASNTAGIVTTYSATNLPAGLSLPAGTSTIVGTPTGPVRAGNAPPIPTITVTNAGGLDTKQLFIEIQAPVAPVITSIIDDTTPDGANYFYRIEVNAAASGVLTFNTNPAQFPTPGLQLQGNLISGTPATPGDKVFTITVTNEAGQFDTKTFTLHVTKTPAKITNNPLTVTGTAGVPFIPTPLVNPTGYPIVAVGTNSGANLITFTAAQLPPGLSLPAGSNVIVGTPSSSAVGTHNVTLTANNGVGPIDIVTLQVIIMAQKPVITSGLSAFATEGVPFNYTLTASGTPLITYGATNLPAGLTFAGNKITGTPGAAAIGSTNVTVTATNAGGTDTQNLVISVSPAPVVITSPLVVNGQEGTLITYQIQTTGVATTFGAQIPANLADDFVLGGASADTFTFTPKLSGTFSGTISADSDVKIITFNIAPAPPLITGALTKTGKVGQVFPAKGLPGAFTLTATGSAVISYKLAAPTTSPLPAGLSLVGDTIVGMPLVDGIFSVPITATNFVGQDTKTFLFTILPSAPLLVVPAGGFHATPGVFFTQDIIATGSAPITFDVQNRPAWLSFDGLKIFGTPALSDQTNPTTSPIANPLLPRPTTLSITATNGLLPDDLQLVSIDVTFRPAVITSVNLPAAFDGVDYGNFQIAVTGSPLIVFSTPDLAGTGLTLSTTGVISGVPILSTAGVTPGLAAAVTIPVRITAANTIAPPSTPTFQLTINPTAPTMTDTTVNVAQGGVVNFDVSTLRTLGTLPTFTLVPGTALPTGLTFANNVISGTLNSSVVGTFVIPIQARNIQGTAIGKLTLIIQPAIPVIVPFPATVFGTVGQPYTFAAPLFTVVASNFPTSFTASGLPANLSIDPTTGAIIGTATDISLGTIPVTIVASNVAGSSQPVILNLQINDPRPQIVSPLSVTGAVNLDFTPPDFILVTGAGVITVTVTGLPPGLTFVPGSNIIMGRPTEAGIFVVTVTANSALGSDSKQIVFTITPEPPDVDGDGFASDLERAVGTDQFSAASTPFANLPALLSDVINIQKLTLKLNFTKANKDSISLRGNFNVPTTLTPGTNERTLTFSPIQRIRLVTGGLVSTFVTDAKGNATGTITAPAGAPAPGGEATFKMKVPKLKDTLLDHAVIKFTATMKKGSFSERLKDELLDGSATVKRASRTMNVFFLFDDVRYLYESRKVLSYTAKAGKAGSAKAVDNE